MTKRFLRTALGCLAATCLLVGTTNAALLLHYEFEEGSGTAAASTVNSTAGNTLDLTGGSTWGTDPWGGSALELTARADIAGAADPASWALPPASSLTLALWVNLNATSGANPSLAGALSDTTQAYKHHYMIRATGGDIYGRGFVRDANKAHTIQGPSNDATTQVPLNEWSHVAITLDASDTSAPTLKYYLDGDLKTTTVGTAWDGWGDASTLTFSGVGNAGYSFAGLYDDVRVYDEVLSDAAIKDLATIPEPGTLVLLALGFVGLIGFRRAR